MSGYTLPGNGWIKLLDFLRGLKQAAVLGVGKVLVIATLQLDADGEIITLLLAVKAGNTGVPGAFVKWHELDDCSVALNQ